MNADYPAPRFPQGDCGVSLWWGSLDIGQSCAIITSVEKGENIRVISEDDMKKTLLFLLMLILAIALSLAESGHIHRPEIQTFLPAL